jgi:hypothetical protein
MFQRFIKEDLLMKHHSKLGLWRAVFTGLVVTALLALIPQTALAQDPNPIPPVESTCLDAGLNCTAKDFGDLVLVSQTSKSGCINHDNSADGSLEMLFDFTIRLTAASATRYDAGVILSLDGRPTQRTDLTTIACLKDYLPTPLTTIDNTTDWPNIDGAYWDAETGTGGAVLPDTCGDLAGNDAALRTYTNVWVACVDNVIVNTNGTTTPGQDGRIDLNLCVLYDNNTKNACLNVYNATAGTTAKCGCGYYVTFPFTPTAVSLLDMNARSSQGYLLGGLGLLLAAGASGSFWLYRKQARKAA